MADQKPSSHYYSNLGGVNQKSSEYSLQKSEFLDLRNLDFNVPNSLQKRPGSTQAVTVGTSGPINSLFEYVRLDGASFLIAGSNTAMFYVAAAAYTLLDTGWTNGQPTDMLTFVNKLWMANGQNYKYWGGSGAVLSAGLPCTPNAGLFLSVGNTVSGFLGITYFLVANATMVTSGISVIARGVYLAYSYNRDDGYRGPADFLLSAKNIICTDSSISVSGDDMLGNNSALKLGGFTVPVSGISSVSVWIAVDSLNPDSAPTEDIPGLGPKKVGRLGWLTNPFGSTTGILGNYFYLSQTLKPTADLSRFYFYTTIPGGSFFAQRQALVNSGVTYWAASFFMGATGGIGVTGPLFNSYTGMATGNQAFSAMPFCWFNSNTPKYIDVNQNVMFLSGFSNTPSQMWFSEIGEPENIQPESFFEVRTNDGDRIIAHKAYNNQVVVLKENSFHKIVGDSPENFELVELSLEYGCLSNKTVVEFREKLAWLDTQGVVIFDGASWDLASYAVEDIFRRMNLSAAKEKACAINQLFRNQLWFGIPIDGATENNVTVVYDYIVNAWTFFDGFNPASFAMVKGALSIPTAWRGDYSGKIHYHGESFYGDNGQGISCGTFSAFDKWDGENSTSIWRRFFLDVQPATGLTGVITGEINVSVFADYNKTDAQATFAIYQNQFQSRAEIGVVGKAVAMKMNHFSASLPLLINGYTWTKRFLRNV